MRPVTVWTSEMDAYLREHYPSGTIGDIADHFGLSGPTVSKRAKLLGLVRVEGWNRNDFHSRYVAGYRHGCGYNVRG